MTIVAKPIIDKQFWILQKDNEKIGNVEACTGGYQVKINNQVAQFKTIKMITQRVNIEFESAARFAKSKATNQVHGYPTAGKTYNSMWDVQHRLPIFTKTKKSKSWFAAGWYRVKPGRHWQTCQDPKLIVLQRYPYAGPFMTQEEADEHTSTTLC